METRKAASFSIKVPWGHVAAKAWGNEQNTKVLLVHGVLDNAGSFDRLIGQLPRNFYYVCIDLPGHGLSSHFPPGIMLDYFCYVFALRCVLDSLQWNQTKIIGHSLGAHLSFIFSIIYPERVEKLILIEGIIGNCFAHAEIIPRILDQQDLAIKAYNLKGHKYYTKEEILYALTKTRKCCLSLEAANALFERSVTKVGDDSYYYNRDFRIRHSLKPLFSREQSSYLVKQIKVETLIILATEGIQCTEKYYNSQWLDTFKNFNHVNLIEVNGNHDVHNNHPERISGHISKFLNISSKL